MMRKVLRHYNPLKIAIVIVIASILFAVLANPWDVESESGTGVHISWREIFDDFKKEIGQTK